MWSDLFAPSQSIDQALKSYSLRSQVLIQAMTDAYRRGDKSTFEAALHDLEVSRDYCMREPFRSRYEYCECYAGLCAALFLIDDFEFNLAYKLGQEVVLVIQEKAERRARLKLPAAGESYLRLFLLSVLAVAKWKGPAELREEIMTPEELWTEFDLLHGRLTQVRASLPEGFAPLLTEMGVSIQLVAARWLPERLNDISTQVYRWTGFLAGGPPRKSSHAYWRYQAGLYLLQAGATVSSLEQIERALVRTAKREAKGEELTQYLFAINRELRWIRKSQQLWLVA